MRFLFDTHYFLWHVDADPRLDEWIVELLEGLEHQPVLSIASLWEMAVKTSVGKLRLPKSFAKLIPENIVANGFEVLPISPEHLDTFARLPLHHRDPFDRLIVAQAIAESIPVLTVDPAFRDYPVQLLQAPPS